MKHTHVQVKNQTVPKVEPLNPNNSGKPSPGLGSSVIILLILWTVLLAIHHLARGSTVFNSLPGQAATLVVLAGLGTWLWKRLSSIHQWLTSPPFVVALFTLLLLSTALGTVLLQGQTELDLRKKYGEGITDVLMFTALNDIFHALPFRGMLVLMCCSLILVTLKRKAWHVHQWGFLLSHTGVVIILAGGLIGGLSGMKGFIDLHEGQTASTMAAKDSANPRTVKQVPLGFSIKLDKFEIDRYPPEYRFYVYTAKDRDYERISSHAAKKGDAWIPLGTGTDRFRILAVYPDFHLKTELQEVSDGTGQPALEILARDPKGNEWPLALLAGLAERNTAYVKNDGVTIHFLWDLDREPNPVATEAIPESHRIDFRADDTSRPESIPVSVGQTVQTGGGAYEITVARYLPDFIYDMETKQATSRSDMPNNPALRVVVKKEGAGESEERWLFARMPDYGNTHSGQSSGPRLTYLHTPEQKPAEHELLVIGKTREVLQYRYGKLQERQPLILGQDKSGFPNVVFTRLLEKARESHTPLTRSDQWRHPVAEIEIQSGAKVHRRYVRAGPDDAVRLSDQHSLLVFDKKPEDVKAFRSRVSVLEGSQKVLERSISVNDALSYRGFQFYQSNYRQDDPTYSGLLVVKDPGLNLVYIGFVMVGIGVLFIFYIRPILIRRRTEALKRELATNVPQL